MNMEIVGYLIIGLVAGTLGGLLGIGGGAVMVPSLNLIFDKPYHLAAAASLVCTIFVAGSSAYGHWKNRFIMTRVLARLLPVAMVSAIFGAVVGTRFLPAWIVYSLFALFLGYSVVKNIEALVRNKPEEEPLHDFTPPNRWVLPLIAIPMGLVQGILGIGGGVVAVPALHMFLKLPLKNAIATSSATIVFSAIIASVSKLTAINGMVVERLSGEVVTLHWHDAVLMGLLMASTAVIFGRVGAHMVKHSPTKFLRIAFVIVLAWATWKYSTKAYSAGEKFFSGPAAVAEETAPATP